MLLKPSQVFFDKQSNTWDDNICKEDVYKTESIFKKYLFNLKESVLDIGSGTGILLPIFKQFGISNKNVFELDISSKMLTCAREKYEYLYDVNYIQADGHSLPLSPNYFGSVVCFQVFPHFHNKLKAAEEIFATLNMNGLLVILHLMGHAELNEMHRQAGREVEKDRILPAEKLAQLLASVGFSIEHVEENPNLYLICAKKVALKLKSNLIKNPIALK